MSEQNQHDDPPMSLVAHLTELRDRLLRAVLAVLIGFIILFPFANEIYGFVSAPLRELMPEGSPTNLGLRLNYYPAIRAGGADDSSGAGRLLGHEDVSLFTMLPAPKGEGLQVLNRKNFKWIALHKQEGYSHADRPIIVNTGK